MICARCKREFIDTDNGLFITCPNCRRPDKAKRKGKRFAEGGTRDGRTVGHKENIQETKFGRDG